MSSSHMSRLSIAAVVALALPAAAHARTEWEFHASPGPGNHFNILYDVSGVSADDVWAVGRADLGPGLPEPPDERRTLVIHWDGTGWTDVPAPSPGNYWNDLVAVTGVASDDVWAFGTATDDIFTDVLAVHWDGTAWSVVDASAMAGAGVWGAHAIAADDVWVVGIGPGFGPLAAHWDGAGFELTAAPIVGSFRNDLLAVDAAASDDVWSVGHYRNIGETFQFLIMRFDGASWTVDPATFAQPTINSSLRGVAVVEAGETWAVGDHHVPGEGTQPLIMHQAGGEWSLHALPLFPDGAAELRAVAARGIDDVWAAGTHATDEGVPRPLIMHYDGADWSVVEPADTGGSHEWFRGVAVTGGDVWAVGQFFDGELTTTLTERRPAGGIPGDLNGDGVVGIADLLTLLAAWGACPDPPEPCPADLNGDGIVGIGDLLILLANWG